MRVVFLLLALCAFPLVVSAEEPSHETSFPTAAEAVTHRDFVMGSLSQGLTRSGSVLITQGVFQVENIRFATSEIGAMSTISGWKIAAGAGVTYNRYGTGISLSGSVERETRRWVIGARWLFAQPTTYSEHQEGKTEKISILAGEPAGEACYRFTDWFCAGLQAGASRISGKWAGSPGPEINLGIGPHASLTVGYGRIFGLEHGKPDDELLVVVRLHR